MIWSSVRRYGGGAIMTPAAPASIEARGSERIDPKPGAETPTMTCMFLARLTKRTATCSASEASSFGASPKMPSTVTPSQPTSAYKSVSRSIDFSSMRPSSWNGVGAIAKVPAALGVSLVICASSCLLRHSGAMRSIEPGISRFRVRCCASPRNDVLCLARADCSKPSRAHLDLFLGEENLPGVFDDILRFPSGMRRLPARFFHHPHLAHAAGSGNAEHLAGLVARQFADHV